MNQELSQKLKTIKKTRSEIVPDAAWIKKTRGILLMQVGNSMPLASQMTGSYLRQTWRSFAGIPIKIVMFLRRPTLTVLSVISVVAGGSIASVSAAERAVPGDFLYPVKLATEQTRLAFVSNKGDKLELKTEFVARRAQEIKDIVTSDVSEKPQRIHQATDLLTRDLNTVKAQLNEVSNEESSTQTAQTAKAVDQKSSELVTALHDVKMTVPVEVQSNVAEAENAAVNAGVKAVQVLIDAQAKANTPQVATKDELIKSIDGKVQGLQNNLNDARQQLLAAQASSSASTVATTSTVDGNALVQSTTTSSLAQIKDAQTSLTQAKELLQQDKLDQVPNKLLQTANAVADVQKTMSAFASDFGSVSSSVAGTSHAANATGTVNGSATSVLLIVTAPTSSQSLPTSGSVSSTSSTNMPTTIKP